MNTNSGHPQNRFPSQEEIDRASATQATLRSWGVPCPPPTGWRKTLIRLHKAAAAGLPLVLPDWYIPEEEREEQDHLF